MVLVMFFWYFVIEVVGWGGWLFGWLNFDFGDFEFGFMVIMDWWFRLWMWFGECGFMWRWLGARWSVRAGCCFWCWVCWCCFLIGGIWFSVWGCWFYVVCSFVMSVLVWVVFNSWLLCVLVFSSYCVLLEIWLNMWCGNGNGVINDSLVVIICIIDVWKFCFLKMSVEVKVKLLLVVIFLVILCWIVVMGGGVFGLMRLRRVIWLFGVVLWVCWIVVRVLWVVSSVVVVC